MGFMVFNAKTVFILNTLFLFVVKNKVVNMKTFEGSAMGIYDREWYWNSRTEKEKGIHNNKFNAKKDANWSSKESVKTHSFGVENEPFSRLEIDQRISENIRKRIENNLSKKEKITFWDLFGKASALFFAIFVLIEIALRAKGLR